MRRLACLLVLVASVCPTAAHAAPPVDSVAALKACWSREDAPRGCEAVVRELGQRPRPERLQVMNRLVGAADAPSKAQALWLAVQTHTTFDDPAVAEGLLTAEDARVLSLALDYLMTFKTPVHASVVNELATRSTIPNVRAAAIRLLPEVDSTLARAAAREGLSATSGAVQAAAAGVLGRLKDLESVDTLVRLVSDPRHPIAVRLEVTEALRRIGDPTVAALLLLQLRGAEPILGHKLVTAFGEISPPELAPFITDELTGEYSREVIVALARMKNVETTQALLGLFERPDVHAQTLHQVFWALAQIKDPAAVPSLLVQLRSADAERAERAAEALGEMGARGAVRPLVEQLARTETDVTDMVAWALEKITGQNFEKDRAEWDAWLEQNPY